MRRSPPFLASLACAAGLAACGRLADSGYQAPAVATLVGTLHDGGAAVEGPVLLALSWQPAGRTGELFVELDPRAASVEPSPAACTTLSAPSMPCDGRPWKGDLLCQEHDDLLGRLAQVVAFEPRFPASFSVPIQEFPPAAARYALPRQGGHGALALGRLVAFVDEDGDGRIRFGTPDSPPERALADSANQDHQPAAGVPRVSWWVAFLDGAVDAAHLAEGRGALAGLPAGFSLWKRTEEVAADGRVLSAAYAVETVGAPLELFAYPGDGGLAVWCTERAVERLWRTEAPADDASYRCTASRDSLSCVRRTVTAPCRELEERYELATTCTEPPPPACSGGGWARDGTMPATFFQAALLQSGMLLVLGTDSPTTGAELYDPATDAWWPTGSMTFPRNRSSVTVLASGEVLVAGGASTIAEYDRSAELYDPDTGTWSPTGSMAEARAGHGATLLPSGKVLVAGGWNFESVENLNGLASAELYDPATGTWSPAAPLPARRPWHAATLLPSGLVLVAGDYEPDAGALLYDPASDAWRATGSMRSAHQYGTFTLLPSGRVLALGSVWGDEALAELYDPATGAWTLAAPMLHGRWEHGAAVLPSGRLLVAGGRRWNGTAQECLSDVETYDEEADRWSPSAPLAEARSAFATVRLPSGVVLVAGGDTCGAGYLAGTELYCEGPP